MKLHSSSVGVYVLVGFAVLWGFSATLTQTGSQRAATALASTANPACIDTSCNGAPPSYQR